MSSFAYIDDLKDALEADQTTWEAVLKKIHGSKTWKKADWKKRRAEMIGDACGACGSTSPPLVLQHTWHPAPFAECCEVIKTQILETTAYLERHPFPADPPPFDAASASPQPFEMRNSCPKCGSVNIRQHKDGTWKCNSTKNRRACDYRFAEPVVIEYRKFDDAGWLSHLESKQRWEAGGLRRQWGLDFMAAHKAAILKGAALIALEEHRRYVEMRPEDVVTRCKKCAFVEDLAFTVSYGSGVRAERRRKVVTEGES